MWDADARFRSSLLQTVATGLDAWQEPQIAAATIGDSQISAEWLLDGANTLYLVAPADDQRRLRGLFAALLADITAGAFAQLRQDRQADRPGAAARTRRGGEHRAATEPRRDRLDRPGQGVQLLSVFQDISQAADRWGRERAETIFANHRARLFTSGIGDRATLEYLSHTLGEEEIARVATHRQSAPDARLAHALDATSVRSPPPTACASRTPTPRCSSTDASRPPGCACARGTRTPPSPRSPPADRHPRVSLAASSRPLRALLGSPPRWAR